MKEKRITYFFVIASLYVANLVLESEFKQEKFIGIQKNMKGGGSKNSTSFCHILHIFMARIRDILQYLNCCGMYARTAIESYKTIS